MTTKAGAGHFGPLIPFARAFQRAGADVLIAAPREAAPMVRAEGLPLWAVDDPPAEERDAIFAEVRGKNTDGLVAEARRRRRLRPHRRAGGLPGDPRRLPSVVARRRHQRDDGVRGAARGRARRRLPSVCIGLSQQGKEEYMLPLIADADRRPARATPASRPIPAAARLLRRPYFTLFPAALEDPATPTRLASHRFREPRPTVRRHSLYGGPADDRPLVYVTFGSAVPQSDFFPSIYRDAIDALAPAAAARCS